MIESSDAMSPFSEQRHRTEYYYDGLGRLAAKAINDGANTYTQSYAYIGTEPTLLQAKAGDGTITTYLSGQGPNDYIAESKNGVYKGYVTDHLNSVLNSEMAGPLHRFSLFGEPSGAAPLSPSSDPASFGFAGGMHNRESKTTKFNWRDLNHDTGRWQQPDPIGYRSLDPNDYAYVGNEPTRFVDPDGLAAAAPEGGGGYSCEEEAEQNSEVNACRERQANLSFGAQVCVGVACVWGMKGKPKPTMACISGGEIAIGIGEAVLSTDCNALKNRVLQSCRNQRGEAANPSKPPRPGTEEEIGLIDTGGDLFKDLVNGIFRKK